MATKRTTKTEEAKQEAVEAVEAVKHFIVLHGFTDLEDKNYEYKTGDVYPRKGYVPTTERIKMLSSFENAAKYPIIGTEMEVVNDNSTGTYR